MAIDTTGRAVIFGGSAVVIALLAPFTFGIEFVAAIGVALALVIPFMHLSRVRRQHSIDYLGFTTLTGVLVAALFATTWGGVGRVPGSIPRRRSPR